MIVGRVKQWARSIIPPHLLRLYRRSLREIEHIRNARRTPEQVFSDIYRRGRWGQKNDQPFCSGAGSTMKAIVDPYINAIAAYLASLPEGSRRVVDLGCGDFGVGKRIVPFCDSYLGVDVVPALIHHHNASNTDPRVKFALADIIDDELPAGDVCLVRQVLQHLSNAQIVKVLQKLDRYHTVFITEHYPADDAAVVPNKDKVHGGGIRLFDNSAVYFDQEPFHFFPSHMQLFLEVSDDGFSDVFKSGVIRTFKFDFAEPVATP